MQDPQARLAEARDAFSGFIDSFQSLCIASVDSRAMPLASYAPFVRDEAGDFYVFVSLLADHTQNLLDRPQASVLLIEPESEARQIFARRRATFLCEVAEVARDSEPGLSVLARFRTRFGEILDLLNSLGDFRLLRLRPTEGRFVIGFGQAYRLVGNALDELEPIGPDER